MGKKIPFKLDLDYKIEIIERMKLQQQKLENDLLAKQQEIVNKNIVIHKLEKNFFYEKEKSSKKIAILQRENEEKSRMIENLTNQLEKEKNRIKDNYEREIIDLKDKLNQSDKVEKKNYIQNGKEQIKLKNYWTEESELELPTEAKYDSLPILQEKCDELLKEKWDVLQTIEDFKNKLDSYKDNYENRILHLKEKLNETDELRKKNESLLIELKSKSEEIINYKNKLQTLQCTAIKEKEDTILDRQNEIVETKFKKNNMFEMKSLIKVKDDSILRLQEKCDTLLKENCGKSQTLEDLKIKPGNFKLIDQQNEKEILYLKRKYNETGSVRKENESFHL